MQTTTGNTPTKRTRTSAESEEIKEFVFKTVDSRVHEAFEEYVRQNEHRVKEMALMERVIRVEEELKYLREKSERNFEASEKRFEALQREMNARFESLQREMNARFEAMDKRFEAVDKRFEAVDKRFESLHREMDARFGAIDARFEAMDKRFTTIQWMIGIFVGIPALFIALSRLLEMLQ